MAFNTGSPWSLDEMEDGAGVESSARDAVENETSMIRTKKKSRRISGPPAWRWTGLRQRWFFQHPAAAALEDDRVPAQPSALRSQRKPWPARPRLPARSRIQRRIRR